MSVFKLFTKEGGKSTKEGGRSTSGEKDWGWPSLKDREDDVGFRRASGALEAWLAGPPVPSSCLDLAPTCQSSPPLHAPSRGSCAACRLFRAAPPPPRLRGC